MSDREIVNEDAYIHRTGRRRLSRAEMQAIELYNRGGTLDGICKATGLPPAVVLDAIGVDAPEAERRRAASTFARANDLTDNPLRGGIRPYFARPDDTMSNPFIPRRA